MTHGRYSVIFAVLVTFLFAGTKYLATAACGRKDVAHLAEKAGLGIRSRIWLLPRVCSRKAERWAVVLSSFPFFLFLLSGTCGIVPPTFRARLPPQQSLSGDTLTSMPRDVSPAWLHCLVKLTVKMKCQAYQVDARIRSPQFILELQLRLLVTTHKPLNT